MCLRFIRVENYRAVREAEISLDQTTVFFGENDSGRSSILDALMFILGDPSDSFESRLRPHHFHRGPDGVPGPLRIRLHIAEDSYGQWQVPPSLQLALCLPSGQPRRLVFEFQASLDTSTAVIAATWDFFDPAAPQTRDTGNADHLAWLRILVPALWIHPGWLTPPRTLAAAGGSVHLDPLIQEVELRHRNLVTGDTPSLADELDAGALAAREIIAKYGNVFAGAAPLMSAMASDILSRRDAPAAPDALGANVANKIALLLLLGSVIQLIRRQVAAGSSPILVVENPEANLHPMTLAAVWRILERVVWQKIISTNSATILSNAPIASLRRLTRSQGLVTAWAAQPRSLSRDNLRRVAYHLRSRRPSAMFARCWLLVEGETEFWILPELARVCGYDFAAEGVVCVEFAQSGLAPLIALANQLGIAWHVLSDGDDAGARYAAAARSFAARRAARNSRVTQLRERDIEHCFWANGFADEIRRVAHPKGAPAGSSASVTIRKAIEKTSKPFLALTLIDAAASRGAKSVPPVLRAILDSCVELARLPS
jgi:putative ATP-dependent endonuclease of OLD family